MMQFPLEDYIRDKGMNKFRYYGDALETKMRRANGSGPYYQPVPQYATDLEAENDIMADELQNKVRVLKSLTLDINDEVKYQDKVLNELDDDFEKTGGFLGNTMNRVKRMAKGSHNYYICYLLLFSVAVFFVLWIVLKFR